MLEINYYQWLDGDNCCQQTRDCGCEDINPCDCDEILLELSKLHTDDLILQDLIDELSGETSGGCDCDLEDYYTKEEIDDKNFINQIKTINGQSLSGTGDVVVGTGGTIAVDDALSTTSENPVQNKVITNALNNKLDASAYTPTDLSNYYTKQQSDSYYQPKGNYLTKASGDTLYQPVGNYLTKSTADGYYQPIGSYITKIMGDTYYQPIGDYVTTAKLTQYISNLQEQIDSLKAQVSGCCGSTGETEYRWVTMTGANDYWCDSTTKMSKEKQQMSTDGINWVDTGYVRSGSTVLEENSTDCGYVPPTPPTPTGDKFKLWYSDGNVYVKECDASPVITSAETRAEYDYTNVNQIAIGECPTEIGRYAFADMEKILSVTIPSNIVTINGAAFSHCHGLRTVELTSGLTAIGFGAFYGCNLLSGITIPDSVTSIGGQAFYNCSSLSSVTIGSGVTSIGGSAFENCSSLTSVNIPSSVTSISESVFDACTGLTGITMGNNVTSIGEYAFSNCQNLSGVSIPSSVTSIGHGVFMYCGRLTSIEIPSGVTIIRNNTFQNCVSLSSVTIPNLVTHIENSAFNNCRSLTSVTIPSSVTSMGNNVFQGCSGLTSITVNATTPPTIGTDVFKNSTCPIYVPCESVNAYKSATNWSTYESRIQCKEEPYGDFVTLVLTDDTVIDISGSGEVTLSKISSYIYDYHTDPVYGRQQVHHLTKEIHYGSACTSIAYGAYSDGEGTEFEWNRLTSVTISDSVTAITSDVAFSNVHISSITVPDSIVVLGANNSSCFANTKVTEINIPSGYTGINGDGFFYPNISGCTALTSVTIPSGITRIHGEAFRNVNNLQQIIIMCPTPPTDYAAYTFTNVINNGTFPIYVPAEYVDVYKSATGGYWPTWKDRIQAIPS